MHLFSRPALPAVALGLVATLTSSLLASEAPDPSEIPSLVRLKAQGSVADLAEEAISSGWDVVARGEGWIEVVMPQREARDLDRIARVRSLFGEDGRKGSLREGSELRDLEIQEGNLNDQLAAFRGREDAGKYHTYLECQAEIDVLRKIHPGLLKKEWIGNTHEGRKILAVKITAPGDASQRPSTLITGLHHAREWISVEVPMALIKTLLEGYGKVDWVTKAMQRSQIWVIPVVNPDGHHFSVTQQKMWRKNRRKVSFGFGVDPNRNYGFKWGGPGAGSQPWSQTYRGPEAFSEPEIQAVRDLALREKFVSSLSFHSYSQLVLWPWGYTYGEAPGAAELKKHGVAMAKLTGYKPMQSSGLYRTSGDFCDWFYGATGALTYTFELGTRFVPEESKIAGIVAKNMKAVRYFLENTVKPRPKPKP